MPHVNEIVNAYLTMFLFYHLEDPRVACPTCATTYSLRTGKFGPELKQTGLAGFVSTWAKTATINNASQDVVAYVITRDEDGGRVFCRER